MTWEQLAKEIGKLTPEQRKEQVCRFDCCEGRFYRLSVLSVATEEDEFRDISVGAPYLEA